MVVWLIDETLGCFADACWVWLGFWAAGFGCCLDWCRGCNMVYGGLGFPGEGLWVWVSWFDAVDRWF